jgi:hypothetical protein
LELSNLVIESPKFGGARSLVFKLQNYSITQLQNKEFMANTTALTKDERKKSKRAARKKRKTENPLKPRDYARGSKKPKVKKLARGQAKR